MEFLELARLHSTTRARPKDMSHENVLATSSRIHVTAEHALNRPHRPGRLRLAHERPRTRTEKLAVTRRWTARIV